MSSDPKLVPLAAGCLQALLLAPLAPVQEPSPPTMSSLLESSPAS